MKTVKIANIILASAGVFCLLIAYYVIYQYGWVRDRDFAGPLGPVLYTVLPVVLAALCFAFLRLRSSQKVNAAFLLFSTGASIYAAEITTTIWFSLPSVKAKQQLDQKVNAAKELGVNFDTRTTLEVVTDLRTKGIDAYPYLTSSGLLEEQSDRGLRSKISIDGREVLPLSGIGNKVTVLCNESGTYVIGESDEHGFQNPRGMWKMARWDIIALGDSFAAGYCVPSDNSLVAWIRKAYPATLSLGNAGHGPLLMLASLKEYAEMKPKVVLWFYYEGNDLKDLTMEERSLLLMRYMEGNFKQGLLSRQADIDRALMAHVETILNESSASSTLREIIEVGSPGALLGKTREILTLTQLRQRLGLTYGRRIADPDEDQSPQDETELELFGKILSQANESVHAWGGKLYFVYLPQWQRYARPKSAEPNRDRILLLAETMGLPVIDLHPVFQAQPDPLGLFPLRLHSHYNEAGHRLVAEEVLRSIAPEEIGT